MQQNISAQAIGKKVQKHIVGQFFLVEVNGVKVDRIWGTDEEDVKDFLNTSRCYFDSVTPLA